MSGVLRKIGPETARILQAAWAYRISPFFAANRYWMLYRQRRFSPDEIHFLRLLDPELDLTSVVSKEELVTLQRRLNPEALHVLTEDKLAFHRRCIEAGLPTPHIFAVYAANHSIQEATFSLMRDERDLQRFLQETPSPAFIVKPVSGVHGEGVIRLVKTAGEWHDYRGTRVFAADLVAHLEQWSYRRWMFQELIEGNTELRRLSGAEGLQTVRVVTITDDDGVVRIVAARLRLISGSTAHDNFDYGRTGNLIANLDLASGAIQSVIGGKGKPRAICHVETHPRTGRALLGVRVPGWQQARDLVQRAARAFAPLRTIGWDVGITDDEPLLIEGNVTWDTLTGEPRMGEIYRHMTALTTSRPTPDTHDSAAN